MTKIKTVCQNCQAGKTALKCLSQGHNRIARVGFKPKLC